jgi:tetratricopeptide (TPR) repeat protein
MRCAALVFALACMIPAPVLAEIGGVDDAVCRDYKADPKLRIEACTREIDAIKGLPEAIRQGRLSRRELRMARYAGGSLPFLFRHRANAYRATGTLDLAIRDYDEAIALKPDSDISYASRAELHETKGDHDKAIADYTEVIRLIRGSPELSEENAWMTARYQLSIGDIYRRMGNFSDAIRAYDAVLNIEPKHFRASFGRFSALFDSCQFQGAEAELNRLRENHPKVEKLQILRSYFFALQGRPDNALESAKAAIKRNPRDPDSYTARAGAYAIKGKFRKAMADLRRALSLDPKHAVALKLRASTLAQLGDDTAAAKAYDRAIALDPSDTLALRRRAVHRAMRGDGEGAKLDLERAEAEYGKLLSKRPWDYEDLDGRCMVRAHLGRLDEALADCEASLRHCPNKTALLETRGIVHLKAGRVDAAIDDFTAVLRSTPKCASCLAGRGLAQERRGDAEAARRDLHSARKLDARAEKEARVILASVP